MGRIPAIVPSRSARLRRHEDRRGHSRPVHGSADPADHPLRGAALPGDVPGGGGRPAVDSLRVPRDGPVDAPAGDGADLAAWPGARLPLSAWQQFRRLQRDERVPRRRAVARVERHRQPDHERPHHHLLARRAGRRLRQDRRRRGHDHATGHALDQGQDASAGRSDDPECRRHGPGHDQLFEVLRYGRRLRPDLADDRLRHAVAPGPGASAAGGRTHAGCPHRSQAGRAPERRCRISTCNTRCWSAWNHRSSASRRSTRCTPTSSTPSTNTACRSRRRTTKPIPRRRKVVPVDQWYAAPARAEAAGGLGGRRAPQSASPQARRRGPLSRCA